MDISSILVFAAAYLAVVILPGPAVLALIARILARGPRGSAAYIAGFAAGSLLWFMTALMGVAALAATFSTLFIVIRYAGAAYLLYLAWKFWTAPMRPAALAPDSSPEGRGQLFLAGLAINLGNPKAVVFFLALLPTVVDLDRLTASGAASLAVVLVVIVGGVFTAYAVAAARMRRFFASPKAMRVVNRGSAVAMTAAAAAIASR